MRRNVQFDEEIKRRYLRDLRDGDIDPEFLERMLEQHPDASAEAALSQYTLEQEVGVGFWGKLKAMFRMPRT